MVQQLTSSKSLTEIDKYYEYFVMQSDTKVLSNIGQHLFIIDYVISKKIKKKNYETHLYRRIETLYERLASMV